MYKIRFHKLVLKKDFKGVSKSDKRKIFQAIEKKLKIDPETFGKPLAKDLKGYYRLRIDPYRVVYKVENGEVVVYILKMGLRKDLMVYVEAAKRLKLF